jgi:negative regulator of flagellin synthesis FlgM
MKIGQQPDIAPVPAQPAPVKGGSGASPAARSERKAPGVGVTVSEQARALEQTRAGDASEVDLDKVAAVRQSIEQQSYVVSPETIADRLLANAREMLSRSSS